MIIEVLPEVFRPAVALAGRAVAARSTLPIISNLLIRTVEGRLEVIGTDLEQVVIARCGAMVREEGVITLPYQLLHDWLATVPNAALRIEHHEGDPKANLSVARSKTTMPVTSPQDFPRVPDTAADDWHRATCPRDTFLRAAGRALESVAHDDSRPVLTGVNVKRSEIGLRLAGADGFRLSVADCPATVPEDMPEAIVRDRAWNIVAEAAKRSGADVVFAVNRACTRAAFETDDATVISQLIQGTFPNYKPLIPDSTATQITVDMGDWGRAIRQSRVYAKAGNGIVRILAPHPRDGEMATVRVMVQSDEVGQHECEVDSEHAGEGQKIAFDVKYLDALPSLIEGKGVLCLNGPAKQAVWRQAGDDTFTYVLMPMFVSGWD